MPESPASHEFLTTRWTVVARAGQWRPGDAGPARDALESLCAAYWRPLYAFARRRGASHDQASDDVQSFFATLLARGGIGVEGPERGRFRSFLLAAFQNHRADLRDGERALKRGGGVLAQSLETALEAALAGGDQALAALLDPALDPERCYERAYAREVLARTLERLAAEQARAGKAATFARLRPLLTELESEATHATLAAELGTTAGALKVAIHRLRRRFGELLRAEVRATVADPADVEDELRSLLAALGN
ncbi:MAG: sigma-70 family RNA polymerase sigma factor [Planctomycetes bacterium]|nr:sigma-70 family RNA polymerase sigma factor [Planctomycetota bacterium]